jgi:hypothetical protein
VRELAREPASQPVKKPPTITLQPPTVRPIRYLMQAAVCAADGLYRRTTITPTQAREWIARGPAISTIGYQATAIALGEILGCRVECNPAICTLRAGEEALVCRLDPKVQFPEQYKRGVAGRVVAEQLLRDGQMELLLLRRVE